MDQARTLDEVEALPLDARAAAYLEAQRLLEQRLDLPVT